MSSMNVGRVIGGGLVAGIIINVVESVMNLTVLADAMGDLYGKMGIGEPGGAAIGGFMVLGFVLGLLVAWTYAAVRPRLGAGPGTAIVAGLAVWTGTSVVPIVGWLLMGMFPVSLGLVFLGYTLVELVVGALVAGAIYKESGAA